MAERDAQAEPAGAAPDRFAESRGSATAAPLTDEQLERWAALARAYTVVNGPDYMFATETDEEDAETFDDEAADIARALLDELKVERSRREYVENTLEYVKPKCSAAMEEADRLYDAAQRAIVFVTPVEGEDEVPTRYTNHSFVALAEALDAVPTTKGRVEAAKAMARCEYARERAAQSASRDAVPGSPR